MSFIYYFRLDRSFSIIKIYRYIRKEEVEFFMACLRHEPTSIIETKIDLQGTLEGILVNALVAREKRSRRSGLVVPCKTCSQSSKTRMSGGAYRQLSCLSMDFQPHLHPKRPYEVSIKCRINELHQLHALLFVFDGW